MNHQVFISSYRNDFVWLKWALKSCQKFCQGFCDLPVVAVPGADLPLTKSLAGLAHFRIRPDDPTRGMMSSQCAMLCADLFCPKADFIHLQGSDWLVVSPYDPAKQLHGGKPLLHRFPYALIPGEPASEDHYHQKNWQRGVSALFKVPVEFEYMNRQPFVYPRPLFAETRKQIEVHSAIGWRDYVLHAKKTLFSEQNVLGYVADRWMPHLFHFQLNPTIPGAKEAPGYIQGVEADSLIYSFWSWGGLDYQRNPGDETPRHRIERILGEPVV